jgi:membrane protease YdiL (CAAX protease family)
VDTETINKSAAPTSENSRSVGDIREREAIVQSKNTPWLMLFSRITLFFLVQAVFAVGFYLVGLNPAWENAANWWPLTVTIADLICLVLLMKAFQAEGRNYWDIFRIDRKKIGGDLLALLGLTIITAPLTFLPNVWLGTVLFGDSAATQNLFYRPMPFWAVYLAIIAFPIAQGLTEVPTYYGYVMPRFEMQGMKKWLAVSLPALMLGLQHIAMPLLFDGRFIAWRALMFIPFAFLIGIAFHWRPRLLPYFVVVHIIMNMATISMFLNVAY